MGRIGDARGKRFGLQSPPPVPAQARTRGLASHLVAFFPQLDLEASGAIAAFVVVEHGEHFRFPGQLTRSPGPRRLRVPPGVVTAGYDVQDLAKQLHWIVNPLLVNKMRRAHGVGGCEKMAMAFFRMSSSCASRLLAVRRVRTSAGSVGKGCCAACYHA